MTNEKIKTLEERTESRLENIETLMRNAIELGRKNYDEDGSGIRAIYSQNQALYEQNKIVIDYLQEIYKNQSEVKK